MSSLARRQLLGGLAGLPLATLLADARLAQAAAAGLDDVSITSQGGKAVSAALALPRRTPAPAILLVHEWWGLNDHIKTVAAEFAKEGYVALAIDLYDGKVASSRDSAKTYMGQVQGPVATDTLASWVAWLRSHDKVNGHVGTVGWCFGGGWSLNTAIATPVEATVVYYGRVNRTAQDLRALKGPVLGHYATQDTWINQAMVDGFEAAMKVAGKTAVSHWYEANHAFANPSSGRYDEADAKLAWDRTLAFFKAHLG